MPKESPRAPANDDEQPRPLPSPDRIQELLFDAARLGRIEVIPALIQAGADVAVMNFAGYALLILSCYHGHADAASVLMAHGAPVDQRDRAFGNTALMGAAFEGFGDIVELLLANYADPNAANHAGEAALMFAALFGRTAIVDALLARGADPIAAMSRGATRYRSRRHRVTSSWPHV